MSLRPFLLLIVLIALGALGAGYAFEYFIGLKPCALCLYQRYIYIGVGSFALLGMVLPQNRVANFWPDLCGLFFVVMMLVAGYQVAVEQHWVEAPSFCKVVVGTAATTVEALKAEIMAQEFVPCDKVQWTFGGLSIAAYNFIFSIFVAALCFLAGYTQRKWHV